MGARLGLDCLLYHNTGTYEVPVWDEIDDARDVTLSLERTEVEVARRGSSWKKYLTGLADAGLEFELLYNPSDSDFGVFRDAFLDRSIVDMAIADGPIETSGTEYLRAEMYVTSFSRNEPLEDAVTASVSVKPAESENDPEWVTVA